MKMSPARQPLRQAVRWLAVTVLTVTGASVAVPAHAADSTTCTGTTQVTYSPGLTLTPQTVTVSATDSVPTCVSTDPSITGVITSPYSFPVPNASCNNVQLDPGNVLVIHWNNGQSSTVSGLVYATTTTAGITQTTGTGTVTAGEFTGATGVLTWIYALVNPLPCLTPGGLTSQNGTVLAQIIG
ncbi:hypothetical protein ACFV0R_00220 [Streptomyces sp. NPDC059578]|uniref:hypothetical protein n=1 Tax=Streptomyces sp. NPDC059578 TaxID=3346874 RepID=UPI0036C8BD43